jgi:hypothetical protein
MAGAKAYIKKPSPGEERKRHRDNTLKSGEGL